MSVSVTLPALGESVTEGIVTRWLKEVGETVEIDEPLLEVSTDKVDTEIPSPAAGVLTSIMVAEDETVEIGATLAVIGAPDAVPAVPRPVAEASVAEAAVTQPPVAETPAPAPPAPVLQAPAPAAPAPPARVPQAPAPAAPVRAPEAVQPPPPAAPATPPVETSTLRGQTVAMTRIRRIIGNNLKKALLEQAQLTTVVEVDVTKVLRLRERAREDFLAREGVKLSPLPFFIKAAAQALKAHPVINARLNEGESTITYFDVENIGIAVDTERGLMTPVIKGAGDMSIAGIARTTFELAGRARGSGLTPDDVSGATFTISNTGSRGALFDTVIVPPGQAAILGIGATAKRPAVVEAGEETVLGIRDLVYLSLSYDHRLIDGADAARYLATVKSILETAAFAGDLPPVPVAPS